MNYTETKDLVFQTAVRLNKVNLNRRSAGNVSCRTSDGNVAITPSGVQYDVMVPEDIVVIDFEGNILDGKDGRKPSSEFLLHARILEKVGDVNAVIHTHSYFAITFAVLGWELPPVCIELMVSGGPIPVAPYALPGTVEVGDKAADILLQRPELMGCLLKNHGMVAVGANLSDAFSHSWDIETGAQIYYQAMQLADPDRIPQSDIDFIRQKYNLVPDRSSS